MALPTRTLFGCSKNLTATGAQATDVLGAPARLSWAPCSELANPWTLHGALEVQLRGEVAVITTLSLCPGCSERPFNTTSPAFNDALPLPDGRDVPLRTKPDGGCTVAALSGGFA
jgi:hypothetical protein